MKCRLCLMMAIALFCQLWTGSALAHSLQLYAWVEDGQVRGQAYFRGGHPAVGVEVASYGGAEEPLAVTKTDEQGEFALPITGPISGIDALTIAASTDDGHLETFEIPAEDLVETGVNAPMPPEPTDESPTAAEEGVSSSADTPEDAAAPSSNGEIEKRLSAMERELKRLRETQSAWNQTISAICGATLVALIFLLLQSFKRRSS